MCFKWQWNALNWRYWIALPASPVVQFGNTVSCVSLSFRTHQWVLAIQTAHCTAITAVKYLPLGLWKETVKESTTDSTMFSVAKAASQLQGVADLSISFNKVRTLHYIGCNTYLYCELYSKTAFKMLFVLFAAAWMGLCCAFFVSITLSVAILSEWSIHPYLSGLRRWPGRNRMIVQLLPRTIWIHQTCNIYL